MASKFLGVGLILVALAALAYLFFYPIPGEIVPQPGINVPFTELANGSFSGLSEEEYFFITNQDEWDALLVRGSFPGNVSSLDIDFSKDSILVLVMGQKPSSGYSISVQSIQWLNTCSPGQTCPAVEPFVVVTASAHSPRPDEPVLTVITTPFHMVKVSTRDTPKGSRIAFVVDDLTRARI